MTRPLDEQPFAGALAAVERILNREPEPDEALRQVVAALHDLVEHYSWVGLFFVDDGELALGPWKGVAGPPKRTRVPLPAGVDASGAEAEPRFPQARSQLDIPVVYAAAPVGMIGIDSDTVDELGAADRAFLERVARLVSAHCLVGWDTEGIAWSEVS